MCPRRSNSWKSAPVPGRRPRSWSSTLGALDADPHTIESPPKCTVLAESRAAMSNAPGAIATKCSTTAGSNRTLPVSRSTAQPLASSVSHADWAWKVSPISDRIRIERRCTSWVCSSPSTVDGANLRFIGRKSSRGAAASCAAAPLRRSPLRTMPAHRSSSATRSPGTPVTRCPVAAMTSRRVLRHRATRP